MIKSIKVTPKEEYEQRVFKQTQFNFTDGLNIVFGPNGVGKSTLLNLLANYCCVDTVDYIRLGVSSMIEPLNSLSIKDKSYPAVIRSLNKIQASIDWDGSTCFYLSADTFDAAVTSFENYGYDLMTTMERFKDQNSSSGEKRINSIQRLIPFVEKHSNEFLRQELDEKCEQVNDVHVKSIKNYLEYIKSLGQAGKPTVILDEMDKSLDLQNQFKFWNNFIPQLMEVAQVIIVSHSAFSLQVKDANYIDLPNSDLRNQMTRLLIRKDIQDEKA